MPTKRSKKSINLLEPLGTPSDTWTTIYNWVFSVGRYLMLAIEIIVLVVFFTRFVLDKKNHDLTESINDKTQILSNKDFRQAEVRFRNLQTLFSDVTKLHEEQYINSDLVSEITSSVPTTITMDKFSFNVDRVTMTMFGSDLEVIKDYEFSLRQNSNYSGVSFTVSKSSSNQSEYTVSVTFLVKLTGGQSG